MSNFYLMTRAAYAKLSKPVAKAALRAGFTPDSITILGTAGTVLSALTLFEVWGGAFENKTAPTTKATTTTIKPSARPSRFKASTQSEGAGQASTVTSTL